MNKKHTFMREKYILEELLAASTKEGFALTDEDKEWVNMKPVGKEILDDESWDEFFESDSSIDI